MTDVVKSEPSEIKVEIDPLDFGDLEGHQSTQIKSEPAECVKEELKSEPTNWSPEFNDFDTTSTVKGCDVGVGITSGIYTDVEVNINVGSMEMDVGIKVPSSELAKRCYLCSRKFSSQAQKEKHMNEKHLNNKLLSGAAATKELSCPHCSYTTTLKQALSRHIFNHMEEKPLKCSHCPYNTQHPNCLKLHMKHHSRRYSFSCSQCSYSTQCEMGLTRHSNSVHS